ncbi:MAG: ribose 5-phosphate isomerase A [Tepidisphaerales bacterium]
MSPKERAAEAALQYVQSDMVVGLGTGSTADYILIAIAREIKAGRLRGIRGIPTSKRSEARAIELSIPLATLAQCPSPDVTIDGADEVAPNLDVIKGLGGALLREKVVAQSTRKLIIIADASKRVTRLGTRSPLPVEVIRFAHEASAVYLRSLGCLPTLRLNPDGTPFITDNSNYIYDCSFLPAGMADPAEIQERILHRAGLVDSGLFLGMAGVAIIADGSSIETLTR